MNFIVLEKCKTLSFSNFFINSEFFFLIINLFISLEVRGERSVRHGPQHHSHEYAVKIQVPQP